MFGWIRRVLHSFWGYFDLAGRLDAYAEELGRLRAVVAEHEAEWVSQYDKLLKLHQRAVARTRSATEAVLQEQPSVTDIKADRAVLKAELRRQVYGRSTGVPGSGAQGQG
jgi:phage tail protein X